MNIDSGNIITITVLLIGLIGVWYRSQYRVERMEEKFEEHKRNLKENQLVKIDENKRQIIALWEWKDRHEKESGQVREQFNRENSELKGALLVKNEEFRQIMDILKDIKDRLSQIEKNQP